MKHEAEELESKPDWQQQLRTAGFTVFEAIKVGMSQDKNGLKLTFRVHEEDFDTAEAIVNARLGTRLGIALIAIGDDEATIKLKGEGNPEEMSDGDRAVKMAGMLCREVPFRAWLMSDRGVGDPIGNEICTEDEASTWLKRECGIQSRRELADNPDARQKLYRIKDLFKMARAKGAV